jgi:hypothetical protein
MAPPRRALAAALAAAALSAAAALTSTPANGVPCASVSPASPYYSVCDPTAVPTDYYAQMKAGTINNAALGLNTNGGCDFIEDAFEETFSSTVLNFTRWLPDEVRAARCGRAGGWTGGTAVVCGNAGLSVLQGVVLRACR